jgi:hypothetical protein
MGKLDEAYTLDQIQPLPDGDKITDEFMHFPGVYCATCGIISALYSYSIIAPNGIDENNRPYINQCDIGKCKDMEMIENPTGSQRLEEWITRRKEKAFKNSRENLIKSVSIGNIQEREF